MVALVSSYLIVLTLLKNLVSSIMGDMRQPDKTLWLVVIYAIFQVIFIKLCSLFYLPLSVWLTNVEVPKTEKQYEDSIIYKVYLFGFVNNFIPIIYTAFIRDNVLILPGQSLLGELDDENCLPTGCILTLSIQLFVITFVKYFGGFLIHLIHTLKLSAMKSRTNIPTWEMEYYLQKNINDFMIYEFSEMMIQFGYVSFFMAMCPLIGPIAFLSNILRTKLDAMRLIRQMRRPVPRMNKGIGAWNNIILFSSYFSVVCNAFIIGFNSRFILFVVHRIYADVTKTFFEFMFSRLTRGLTFVVKDEKFIS